MSNAAQQRAHKADQNSEEYRPLLAGETLMLGDQYYLGGIWRTLDEPEYQLWISSTTTYAPEEMCTFRRAINPNDTLVQRSREILNEALGAHQAYL